MLNGAYRTNRSDRISGDLQQNGSGELIALDRKALNSWKEIADYLSRGVRTVQRWEHQFRLPVHRPSGENRNAVVAFSDEIDKWLAATPVGNSADQAGADSLRLRTHELIVCMQNRTLTLIHAAEKLQSNVLLVRKQQQRWRERKQQPA